MPVISTRRPTQEETTILILQLAARLEQQSLTVAKAAVLGDHQKANLAHYLKCEATNLRALLGREARDMDSADGSVD